MSAFEIRTADDETCGVRITRASLGAYALEGIETGVRFGVAFSPTDAIRRAGEYLMDYGNLDSEPVAESDWTATVQQGREMLEGPEDCTAALESALDDNGIES